MAAEQRTSPKEEAALGDVVARLRRRFPNHASATVEAAVRQRYAILAEAKIRDFIAVLVESGARTDLEHSAPNLP